MAGIRFAPGRPELAPVALDAAQRAVLELPLGRSAAVLGAPGSGTTTTLIEFVADRVHRGLLSPAELLVLAPSRLAAARLRDALATRLAVATDGPLARTAVSLAFEIVGARARRAGDPVPRLLTGGEQDADLAALLEGEIVDGAGAWEPPLGPEVRRLRGFRDELRELLARATEFGLGPEGLAAIGRREGRAEWIASGAFLGQYRAILASSRPDQLDPAELGRAAVAAIEAGEGGERVERLRLVAVDDLHEATETTLALLRALAARGVAIVGFGDPDVATNAFRGGEPDALGRLASRLGVEVDTLVLEQVHRHGPALRALTSAVTERIGTAAAGRQRRAVAARGDAGPATVLATVQASTPARQWSAIARALRERHLRAEVPWSGMAVVVRENSQVRAAADALALAEVPTRTLGGGVALRDQPAARALLALLEVATGRRELDADTAAELLLGPFGGLDPLGLRRLRRALRAEEVAGGGDRPSSALLVEALAAPGRLATIDAAPARAAVRLAETLELMREPSASAEDRLWTGWERSRVAEAWRATALGGGPGSAEAERDLDGVVALFSAAKRYAERLPDASPEGFLTEVLDADVPDDLITPARASDAVVVTTPSGVVGLEFDTVVVAGLQEGRWPDLRPRGSLLGAPRLARLLAGAGPGPGSGADAASGPIDERRLVRDDELRLFALAVSRARERLLLAAVANDDETPSLLFGLLPEGVPELGGDPRRAPAGGGLPRGVPLTLRGATGALRRLVADPAAPPERRSDAARTLAELAARGLPGADPDDWHGLRPPSSRGPLFEGEAVPVSPSAVERIESSPLDWFLERIAAGESGLPAAVGTILHWAMETAEPGVDALWAAVESRWDELIFDAPWLGQRQRVLARGLTEALAEYLADAAASGVRLVGSEDRFVLEYPAGDEGPALRVSGSIDRVERAADGSVVIVDLKTGTPVTNQGLIDANPQLGSYQLAYAEGLLDEALAPHGPHAAGGARLLFVKSGVRGKRYRVADQASLDEAGLEAVRARLRAAAKVIAMEEFAGPAQLELRPGVAGRLMLHRVAAVSSDGAGAEPAVEREAGPAGRGEGGAP
ncbi:MAG: ATP-dependent helicase [Actinomycetales bacterium]|nr:ATP-dependent helicase [Actinomycetales bacterium]